MLSTVHLGCYFAPFTVLSERRNLVSESVEYIWLDEAIDSSVIVLSPWFFVYLCFFLSIYYNFDNLTHVGLQSYRSLEG